MELVDVCNRLDGIAWALSFLAGIMFMSLFKGRWFFLLLLSFSLAGSASGVNVSMQKYSRGGVAVYYHLGSSYAQEIAGLVFETPNQPSLDQYYCPYSTIVGEGAGRYFTDYHAHLVTGWINLQSPRFAHFWYNSSTLNTRPSSVGLAYCTECIGIRSGSPWAMCTRTEMIINTNAVPFWPFQSPYVDPASVVPLVVEGVVVGVNYPVPVGPPDLIIPLDPFIPPYVGPPPASGEGSIDVSGVESRLDTINGNVVNIAGYSALLSDIKASSAAVALKDWSPSVSVEPPVVNVAAAAAPVVNVSAPVVNVAATDVSGVVGAVNGASGALSGKLDTLASKIDDLNNHTVGGVFSSPAPPSDGFNDLPALDLGEVTEFEQGASWKVSGPAAVSGGICAGLQAFFGSLPDIGSDPVWLSQDVKLPGLPSFHVGINANAAWVGLFRTVCLFACVSGFVWSSLIIIRGAII